MILFKSESTAQPPLTQYPIHSSRYDARRAVPNCTAPRISTCTCFHQTANCRAPNLRRSQSVSVVSRRPVTVTSPRSIWQPSPARAISANIGPRGALYPPTSRPSLPLLPFECGPKCDLPVALAPSLCRTILVHPSRPIPGRNLAFQEGKLYAPGWTYERQARRTWLPAFAR